jgi:hypothetical protein
MSQLSEYEIKSLRKLGESIHQGKWSNDGLVQCVELCFEYLNSILISAHQKQTGLSYNGIKKQNKAKKLLGRKYIFDND